MKKPLRGVTRAMTDGRYIERDAVAEGWLAVGEAFDEVTDCCARFTIAII
jgi:hypothetical protein